MRCSSVGNFFSEVGGGGGDGLAVEAAAKKKKNSPDGYQSWWLRVTTEGEKGGVPRWDQVRHLIHLSTTLTLPPPFLLLSQGGKSVFTWEYISTTAPDDRELNRTPNGTLKWALARGGETSPAVKSTEQGPTESAGGGTWLTFNPRLGEEDLLLRSVRRRGDAIAKQPGLPGCIRGLGLLHAVQSGDEKYSMGRASLYHII